MATTVSTRSILDAALLQSAAECYWSNQEDISKPEKKQSSAANTTLEGSNGDDSLTATGAAAR
jgi:hypothetical protein